jgi:hypothetical protein
MKDSQFSIVTVLLLTLVIALCLAIGRSLIGGITPLVLMVGTICAITLVCRRKSARCLPATLVGLAMTAGLAICALMEPGGHESGPFVGGPESRLVKAQMALGGAAIVVVITTIQVGIIRLADKLLPRKTSRNKVATVANSQMP